MGWGECKAGAGAYIGLKNDGDRALVVLLGDAEAKEVKGMNGKMNRRAYVNAATPEDMAAGESCSILAMNMTTAEALAELLKVSSNQDGTPKYKPSESLVGKVQVEIVRKGMAGSKKTTYEVRVAKKLTPAEVKKVAGLALRDLSKCGTFKQQE